MRAALLVLCVTLASAATASPLRSEERERHGAPHYTSQVINPNLTGGLRVPNSNALIVWGTDGTVFRSINGRDWLHAQTPLATDLTQAAADDKGSVLIAVGAGGTIIRSQDAGRQWARVTGDAVDCDLKAIVYDAHRSTWIAAGTGGCILRSVDEGRTWRSVPTRLTLTFQALFFDARTGTVLIGGDDGVVGTSSDAGVSWNLTWMEMPQPLTPVTGFHRFDRLLLATGALGRFLLSRDDAHSWDLMQSGTRAFFTDAAFDPGNGAIAMVGHDGTILRSADGGRRWTANVLGPEGTASYLSAVRYDIRRRSLLVAGHGGTMARSVDGGATWARVSPRIDARIDGLLQDRAGRFIAFGNGGLIATSVDGGNRWTQARDSFELYLREVAVTPRANTFVATGQLGDILHSMDGASWQRVAIEYPQQETPPDLRALIPFGDGLVAAGPPGAILRSGERGQRWSLTHWTPLEAGQAFPALIADRQRNVLVSVEAHGAMRVSTDGGARWNRVDVPVSGELWQGAVLESDGVMIAAGKSGALVRSVDGGQQWSAVASGTDQDLFGAFADERSGIFFLMGQNGTLLRSQDRGRHWIAVTSGTTHPLRRMLRDPRSGALVCFGGNGVILRSADAGLHWQTINSGTTMELRKSLIEPRSGNVLIVGRGGTLLRSADGGRSWSTLDTHTARHFTSITANSAGDLIAVGERIVRLTPQEQP